MKQHKKNEFGAIMVEILAVLALIGVMGPMLFRQVLDRNKEISNVNMASEMRTVKEAVSAYIAADGSALGRSCLGSTGTSGESKYCGTINAGDIEPFLPAGMDDIMQYYTIKSYAYWIDYGNAGTPDYRPFVYAMIVSNGDGQPQDWNFRRAARVASLIGADGGVVVGASYTGTSGAWELPVLDRTNIQDDSVVATTAFDTFEPDLGIVAPNAVYAPDKLAFDSLHAWRYFSVGDKNASEKGRCFRQVRRMDSDKTLPDEIYSVGQMVDSAACDPLFWVGASGSGVDKSTDGYVYAKKNVYVGRDNANNRSAIALETNKTTANGTINDPVANRERKIVVYDTMGNAKVTIDATGTVVAEKLLADRTTQVQVPNDSGSGTKPSYYGVDAKNTSVLNDVRLTSRGGARLSDILPNYIAKDMYFLSNGSSNKNMMNGSTSSTGSCTQGTYSSANSYSNCSVPIPTCPVGYKKAILLQPIKWKTGVDDVSIPLQSIYHYDSTDGQFWLNAPAGGGTVTGGLQVKAKTTKSTNPITVKQRRAVVFSVPTDAQTSTGNFTVQMGYPYDKGDTVSYSSGELQAVAQTFCVYTGSGTTKAPDNLDVSKNP